MKHLFNYAKSQEQIEAVRRAEWKKRNRSAKYPEQHMHYQGHVRAICDVLAREGGEKWRERGVFQIACLQTVRVMHCPSCSHPVAASGTFDPEIYPCRQKWCPRCARERSLKLQAWAKEVFNALPVERDYNNGWSRRRFRLVTVTARYDTKADMSADDMRKRCKALIAGWRDMWTGIRAADDSAGAFRSIEVAGTGNIHMHILHYGQYLERDALREAAAGAMKVPVDDIGIDIRSCNNAADAAREALKYTAKGPGIRTPGWLAGRRAWVTHPVLAARWMMGTQGIRLSERYGCFRKIKHPEEFDLTAEREKAEAALRESACPCCGEVLTMAVRHRWDLSLWARYCETLNSKPLRKAYEDG